MNILVSFLYGGWKSTLLCTTGGCVQVVEEEAVGVCRVVQQVGCAGGCVQGGAAGGVCWWVCAAGALCRLLRARKLCKGMW